MAVTDSGCFHCGLPVPRGSTWRAVLEGREQHFCCPGCQAVAQAICEGGLAGYYQARTAFPERGQAGADPELEAYDLPELQQGFCRDAAEGGREAELVLEGTTCSACLWLIERTLAACPGVLGVEVNYGSARARLRWVPAQVPLSRLLGAVRAIGYRAFPSRSAEAQAARRSAHRAELWRLFVAGFGMMQVMMLALATYVAEDGTMAPDILQLLRIGSLVLTVPVIGFSCAPFFRGALRDLRLRRLGMDVPVALGIAVAAAASAVAVWRQAGAVYFDSVTMFVFFLLAGRYLEGRARERAVAAVDYLERARPEVCERLQDWPASQATLAVPALLLRPGDRLLVRPGQWVPADGRILEGDTEIDESLLTGEALPRRRGVGSTLLEGTINRGSPVVLEVQRVGGDTHAGLMRRLLQRAGAHRPRLVQRADHAAGWLVGGVLLAALAGLVAWLPVDPARALAVAVAVLVVSCPCALSLATPVALTVATGRLARLGVVLTRGHALETLARATHVAFDKTGTLTQGELALAQVHAHGGFPVGRAALLAAALAAGSEHPVARALAREGVAPAQAREQLAGRGIEGVVDGVRYRLGRPDFVAGLCPAVAVAVLPPATLACLASADGLLAVFELVDRVRPRAAEVVAALRAAGKAVLILSGDGRQPVEALAARLGIDDCRWGLSAEQKCEAVEALQAQGAVVAMVGDGVNDALVLARAQVSVAMGSGAALSQAGADVILLGGRLENLLLGLDVARATLRVIGQNLVWAVLYNLTALPLALAGWMPPWLAGLGMAGSSLVVVLNALRLRGSDRVPAGPATVPEPMRA